MGDVAPKTRALIIEHISTVAQVDILLLLRLRPNQWWSAPMLDQELRLNEIWIRGVLRDLCGRGLCEQSSTDALFRYRPQSAELGQAIDALAEDYLTHRVSVINLIYGKPAPAIQAFSDAFDLRKGPTNV
jgi:hypothetical protein